jgi:DNA-binding response OmpR family regulator
VLVIDDDKSILEVVETILISRGYNVRIYAAGYNVLEIVEDYKPDGFVGYKFAI